MRANFVLSGVGIGIRRNATMTIALVLSTAITLAFVGAAILANIEISRFKHDYESNLNVSVYLCAKLSAQPCKARPVLDASGKQAVDKNGIPETTAQTTPAQRQALESQLKADPAVAHVTYVSEAEQFRRAKGLVSRSVASQAKVGDLPASFTIKLKDISKDFNSFAARFDQAAGVSMVQNQIDVIQRLLDIINAARLLSIIIAAVVLIASILLITNTIQVAAQQRRNETSIMRLVGASRLMTELPFMIETILATVAGGIIAFGMVAFGKHFVLNNIFAEQTKNGVIPNLNVNDLLIASGISVIGGIVLSAIIAIATLRLYVRL